MIGEIVASDRAPDHRHPGCIVDQSVTRLKRDIRSGGRCIDPLQIGLRTLSLDEQLARETRALRRGLTSYSIGCWTRSMRKSANSRGSRRRRIAVASPRIGSGAGKNRQHGQRPRSARSIDLAQGLERNPLLCLAAPAEDRHHRGHGVGIGDLTQSLLRGGFLGLVAAAQPLAPFLEPRLPELGGARLSIGLGLLGREDLRLDPPSAYLLEAQPFPGRLAAGIVLENLVEMRRRSAPSVRSPRTRAPASTGRRPCRASGPGASGTPEERPSAAGSSWTWRTTSSGRCHFPW